MCKGEAATLPQKGCREPLRPTVALRSKTTRSKGQHSDLPLPEKIPSFRSSRQALMIPVARGIKAASFSEGHAMPHVHLPSQGTNGTLASHLIPKFRQRFLIGRSVTGSLDSSSPLHGFVFLKILRSRH